MKGDLVQITPPLYLISTKKEELMYTRHVVSGLRIETAIGYIIYFLFNVFLENGYKTYSYFLLMWLQLLLVQQQI